VNERNVLRHVVAPSAAVFPKRIYHDHLMTGGKIGIDDMGSDKAGSAGDQDAHE
jgi:hypothetical protein